MIPTGDLDDAATIAALLDTNPWDNQMPPCAAECDNLAVRAHFDATTATFVPLCHECEPIPFVLADGGRA